MKYIISSIFILLIYSTTFGQAPEGFTYQAVARDASGSIMDNQNVGLRISILQGSISGIAVYTETHTATTNSFGLINLAIGEGTTADSFASIDWSMGPFFIKVEMDASGGTSYTEFGTSQLLSVPYALHAKTAGNTFSGNYTDLSGTPDIPSNVSDLTNDSGFITNPADADSDPANELQDISLVGTELSIEGGNTVDLSGFASEDTDDQTLSLTGTELTIEGGNAVDLSSLQTVNTDDQMLSLSGTELTIEDGNTVDLGSLSSVDTDDQTLFLMGTVLSIEDGNEIDLTSLVDDADADPENEIQDLNITSDILSITGKVGATPVDLTPYKDNTDVQDLVLSDNTLSLTNDATTIDLSGYLDNTDEQDMELTDNTLSLTNDVTTVDLSGYLDNTDEQDLTNVLSKGTDAGGMKIENLADPVNDMDAATKAYIDKLVLKLGDTDKLLNAGYTLEQMIQSGTPIASLREDGIPDEEIIHAGADPIDMFEVGIGVGTMEQNGVPAIDLESAGLIGTLQDYDLNEYKWVRIGDQIWMAENLRATTFSDGTPLIDGTGATNITGDYSTKYYFAYNDDQGTASEYGRLYTWAATMNGAESTSSNPSGVQGVCPVGWHVPSRAEWHELELFIGIPPEQVEEVDVYRGNTEGNELKELGMDHWITDQGIDQWAYKAVGESHRGPSGVFVDLDHHSIIQLSTEYAYDRNFHPLLSYHQSGIYFYGQGFGKDYGVAVRCLKDDYPENLVLWNKLDSYYQVENSVFGEDGQIIGANYTFEDAEHGKGYVRTATGSNYINFPQTILQNLREKGTVELWINPKEPNPVAFSYGVYALVGNIFGSGSHVYVAWGDGTSGTGIYGSINFDGTGIQTPFESTQFVATVGTPFHIAICWDVNGIDGTTNTVRVYRDGEIIGTNETAWDHLNTAVNYDGFNLGLSPDGQGYDKFIVDNLKVWNIAKTDFSDRFEEGF